MEVRDKSHFFLNIRKTWAYIKDCKANLIGYAVVSIIEAIVGAILPLISANIILNLTNGVMSQLILSALTVFGIEFVLYIVFFFKGFLYQKAYHKTLVNLQTAVARETLKLEIKEIDNASSGLFIDRLNKDTQDISGLFMEYTYWISYVISNIGILAAIFVLNRYLFGYAIISSICIFLINKKRLNKQYKVQRNLKKFRKRKQDLLVSLLEV